MHGKKSQKKDSRLEKLVARLRRAKKERRCKLAKLPIHEKVKIIVKLQEALYPLFSARNKSQLKPWKI